jgi:hypothetical protein
LHVYACGVCVCARARVSHVHMFICASYTCVYIYTDVSLLTHCPGATGNPEAGLVEILRGTVASGWKDDSQDMPTGLFQTEVAFHSRMPTAR